MSHLSHDAAGPLGKIPVGAELGVSEWFTITQDMISKFGAATLDADPMHDDPDWAKEQGPYGSTIAYGFKTGGRLTRLMRSALGEEVSLEPSAAGYPLNYGFDRLRLVAPVPCNSRIRGRFTLTDRTIDERDRIVQRVAAVIEIEGQARPALVAEWLSVWVPIATA